jgi:ribonuclease R
MDGDLVEVVRLRALEARRRQQMRRPSPQHLHFAGDREGNSGGGNGCREMLGSVRRVLKRAHETLVGTVRYRDGLGVVYPFDEHISCDVFLDYRIVEGKIAQDGDVVVVRLTTYPGRLEAAQGYIEEIIGHRDDRDVALEIIIREYDFETAFMPAALEEAAALTAQTAELPGARVGPVDSADSAGPAGPVGSAGPAGSVGPGQADVGGLTRRDLRDRLIFTIDPVDARDFDDALSLDFVDGQMRLGVHIADVSSYVAWGSALDLDARRRATSVYLPDRVIPMLPASLSEELCSLRPQTDRLAFTVEIFLDSDARPTACEFYPSLIHSAFRLTYDEVQCVLEEEGAVCPDAATAKLQVRADAEVRADAAGRADVEGASALKSRLLALHRLAQKLAKRRLQRGAIEFDSVEARPVLDENGVPIDVRLRGKTDATALVEEAMILANEQVATFMGAPETPMIYRVHDEPLPAAMEELLPTLQEFGYALHGAPQSSHEVQAILQASAGRPEHHLVSSLLLRAMKRANYTATCTGHFGLASVAYTHFTSPIRRYPDLMVHRLLRYRLSKTSPPKDMLKQLDWICEYSSQREKAAEQAAREAVALKLCEYLEPRAGQRFTGIISAVNSTGLAVREDTTGAEGFIHRDSLPSGLTYDKSRYRYHDSATDRSCRLGQPVVVRLIDVDRAHARLRFVIA